MYWSTDKKSNFMSFLLIFINIWMVNHLNFLAWIFIGREIIKKNLAKKNLSYFLCFSESTTHLEIYWKAIEFFIDWDILLGHTAMHPLVIHEKSLLFNLYPVFPLYSLVSICRLSRANPTRFLLSICFLILQQQCL